MQKRLIGTLVTTYVTLFALAACSSTSSGPSVASSGSGAEAGAMGGSGGSGNHAGSGNNAGEGSCTLIPIQHAAAEDAIVTLQISPVLSGKPMAYGTPNTLPSGGTVTPTNFRFFVSHVEFLGPDGSVAPADLIGADGNPEQYGIHLFNAEDPASATCRIRVKAGTYQAIHWVLGLDSACNALDPSQAVGPLSVESQMTWPVNLGNFLGLRFEAQLMAGSAGASGGTGVTPIDEIHMGAAAGLLAPVVSIPGPLVVSANGMTRHIDLSMDELFTAASTPIPAGTPALPPLAPEVVAGERLRVHAAEVPLFTAEP